MIVSLTLSRKCGRHYFPNCARGVAKTLPLSRRLQLLRRAVVPVLRFRWTRWPFAVTRANELDALQKQMLVILVDMRFETGDSVSGFFIRRGRRVAALQRQMGKWSDEWARAVMSWDSHVSRERNSQCWPALTRDLRRPEELAERRLVRGRPETRRLPGFVRMRWYESVGTARTWLRI